MMRVAGDWILSKLELPDLTEAEQAASALRNALAKAELVSVKPLPFHASRLAQWQQLLSRLGEVVADGEDSSGMRNGSMWMDVRYDAKLAYTFRHSATAQPLHNDGAYQEEPDDVVLFLCEHQAVSGGETIFVLADTIDACARKNDPELHRQLWEVMIPYGKAGVAGRTVPVLTRNDDDDIIINWNYYRVLHEGNPEVASFREHFQKFLQRNIVEAGWTVPLRIEPGEVILFKDRRVLHGRNAFTPSRRCIWKCGVKLHAA